MRQHMMHLSVLEQQQKDVQYLYALSTNQYNDFLRALTLYPLAIEYWTALAGH